MVKKGASHVDWIISMGIFLVYILGVVVFIKPGLAPAYSPDELFDVVEGGLIEDVELTVQRLPLYVKFPDELPEEPYYFEIGSGLPFDSDILSKLVMYNDDLKTKVGADFDLKNKFQFSPSVSSGDEKNYFIIYNPEGPSGVGLGSGGKIRISDQDYEFGIIQNIKGVSQSKITGFKDTNCSEVDYDLLKSEWKLPVDKEIEINYEFINGLSVSGVMCKNENLVVPQQTDIFVVELVKSVLGDVGELEGEAKINVKVW